MGFLESVGLLAILFVLLFVTLIHLSTRDHKIAKPNITKELDNLETSQKAKLTKPESVNEKVANIKKRIREKHGEFSVEVEIIELSRYSYKCQNYGSTRQRPIYDGYNRFYDNASRRAISAILRDPLEYWTSMERYYNHIEGNKRRKQFEREKIELYIKYNEVVFSIFDTDIYLTKKEIISRINSLLKLEFDNAEKLFSLWDEYLLISQPFIYPVYPHKENKEIYEIFTFLAYGTYDSEFKITRKDWLIKNNKQLIDNYKDS